MPYVFSRDLVMLDSADPARAEPVRAIGQELIAQRQHYGRRGVVVCAPSRGAGVTMLVANLAIVLSQVGFSTLLVDGNANDAGITDLFGPRDATLGLNQLLDPDRHLDPGEVVHREVLPHLSILFSGAPELSADDWLVGARAAALFADFGRGYDFTIVDAPAANISSRALILSRIVGYSLIVARKNRTYVSDVTTLSDELKHDGVEIVGTIMNNG